MADFLRQVRTFVKISSKAKFHFIIIFLKIVNYYLKQDNYQKLYSIENYFLLAFIGMES